MLYFVLFNLTKCARRRIFYLDNAIISQIYNKIEFRFYDKVATLKGQVKHKDEELKKKIGEITNLTAQMTAMRTFFF